MKKQLLILLFFTISISLKAQYSGIWQIHNNAGIREAQLNPSSIADSRLGWQVHLLSGYWLGTNQSLNTTVSPNTDLFIQDFNNKSWQTSYSDISSLGLMIQLPNNHAFVIGSRLRAWQNDNPMLKNLFETNIDSSFLSSNFQNQAFNATSLRDFSIGYALPVYNQNQHFVKIGAAIKFYKTIENQSHIFNSDSTKIEYMGYRINPNNNFNMQDIFNGVDGKGFDFGLTYEFRPRYQEYNYKMDGKYHSDVTQNKYLVKVGLSFLDIGGYSFAKTKLISNGVLNKASLNGSALVGANFDSKLANFASVITDDTIQLEQPKLPSTFVFNVDVSLGKTWYFNALYRNTSKGTYEQPTMMAFGFRTETNNGSWSMPFTYNVNSKQWGVGFHVRLGSFFFGTESLNFLFDQSNGVKPAFYAGISFSGRAKKIKDTDKDGVSNRKDKCVDVQGLFEFKGCPDRDNDGIPDAEDNCPDRYGSLKTKGCPDRDEDGIEDDSDRCPDEKGLPINKGCPDTDNDGVIDSKDACPTVPGPKENKGCPIN
jgi:Thrombospondin type 3 repeat